MITKRKYIYYAAIALVVALTFGIYFFTFHGSISDDSNVWSNFGNYINGLLTPLLTIINIAVFIELTIAISQLEEQRSEKALEKEQELLLMQLRKQEIDTFIQQMNRLNNYSSRKEHIESVQQIWYYLQDFEKTGLKYFKFDEGVFADHLIRRLSISILQYKSDLEENKEFDKELFNKIYDTKAQLVNTLVGSALSYKK
jgi:hypothetical protein